MADVMWHGSSALFSVLIGLEMGYTRIYLAGCPLDSKGHWYFPDEDYGPRWTMETYQAWLDFMDTPEAQRVRSLSGYTAKMLGNYFYDFCDHDFIDVYTHGAIGKCVKCGVYE
jgi:hypothetical protein